MEEAITGEAPSTGLSRGFAVSVNGENVKVERSGVGVVSARNEASLRQGGAAIIAAGHSVQVLQGGAPIMAAGSEMRVMQGGGQLMLSGGRMQVERGGGLVVVANRATLRRSQVGVLISGSTQLQEGARVLLGTPQAMAFGAALGLVFALATRLLKGRH